MKKFGPLVFFGNERLATGLASTDTPVLRALIKNNYHIAAVVSHHSSARSRKSRPLEIAHIAKDNNIPLLLPDRPDEIVKDLESFKPTAGVLVAYGRILPKSIIDIFPRGIINLHPSLLPEYRGPTPIEQAILDKKNKTGISIMQLGAGLDDGPVFARQSLNLMGQESKEYLANKLLTMGTSLLIDHLPQILDGSLEPKAQDNSKVSYTSLITKIDGQISWNKPAQQIALEIRAYSGWPKTTAIILNKELIITKARVASSKEDGQLVVACRPGFLEILELVGPSGKTMSGDDFLRGLKPPTD